VVVNAVKGAVPFVPALREQIAGLGGAMKMLAVPTEKRLMVCERQYTAILTPDSEDGSYSVACKEIPAAISQGQTIQEALDNLTDAIELCLEVETELRGGRVQAQ